MKKLSTISLLDLLPESILLDPKIKASAEALDAQLKSVTAATREVLHLPRLDELSGTILDYLAEQFHLDFYEPLYLTEAEKRNLIRESIAWHRIKGTPAAVEKLAHEAFRDAKVVEWFEYGGEPYHFKISSKGYKQTPDGFDTFVRMVNVAKNVRSWCDNFEVDYSELIEPARAFVADAAGWAGVKTVSLARPPNLFKTTGFAGNANFSFGNKAISLHQPLFDGQRTKIHVGQLLEKFGQIVLYADPGDMPPYAYFLESPFAELLLSDAGFVRDGRISIPVKNYWQRQESFNYVGTGNFICGLKTLSLPEPRDEVAENYIGQGYTFVGTMKISPEFVRKRKEYTLLRVGLANLRSGYITVDSATTSSIDPNRGFYGRTFQTEAARAGGAVGWHGVKELSLHIPNFTELPTIRVGQILTKLGDIVIGASTTDFPPYTYRLESPLAELLLGDVGFVRDGQINYPVLTYEREFEAPAVVKPVLWTHGQKTLSLPEPKDEVAEGFFGLANRIAGHVEIKPDNKIHRSYPTKAHVGLFNLRHGKIEIDSEYKSTVDGNVAIEKTYQTNAAAVAQAEFKFGDVKINADVQPLPLDPHLTKIHVGQVNLRSGFVKIGTETKSSVPENEGYFTQFYRTDNFAGVGSGAVGTVKISPDNPQKARHDNLITIRVGQPIVRAGEIKIFSTGINPWDDMPPTGDWLRLWFDFPNSTRRTLLLSNPREDLEKSDIREVGDTAAGKSLMLNSAGESTTGISLAALVRRNERKIL